MFPSRFEYSAPDSLEEALATLGHGMTVPVVDGAIEAEHGGNTYYFCAPGCRKTFLADPASALERASAG